MVNFKPTKFKSILSALIFFVLLFYAGGGFNIMRGGRYISLVGVIIALIGLSVIYIGWSLFQSKNF